MKKNKLLVKFFALYFKNFLKKNFYAIYSKGHIKTAETITQNKNRPILFVLNHSNWWDGVIVPFLDLTFLKTNGYCLMEKKQIDENKFFGKIGAIEIIRDNPYKSIKSLNKCVEILNKEKSRLYIFPQGVIEENGTEIESFNFQRGYEYIIKKTSDLIVINCLINYKFVKEQRPEIYLNFFEITEIGSELNKDFVKNEEEKFRLQQRKFNDNYRVGSLSEYEKILTGKKSKDKRKN